MVRLSDFHLAPDPRSDPAVYPGDRLTFDYLLEGDDVRPLLAGTDGWPVGDAARRPVVAFGSNAAPAQLAAKLGSKAGAIPVTRARLFGFAVGHSAHVSVPGYLPWVLVDEPGGVVDGAVLWLDDRQLARLDVTEPNYHLVPVDPLRYPLVVAATEVPISYLAYRGKWGALRWPGEARPTPASSQAGVFGRLGTLDWFRDLVGAGGLADRQRRLAADPALRNRVRDELAARGMAVPDGWVSG
jgi:hypothetical protein